jgi:hypothetical protein
LGYLYQTSSLLHRPFPTVDSASLRLLYSFLYHKHINHIQVFGFFPFLTCFPSLTCSVSY